MGVTTIVTKSDNNYNAVQRIETTIDDRRWRINLNSTGTSYYTLKIADDYKISREDQSGATLKSIALNASNVLYITMAINRALDKIYVVYRDQTTGNIKIRELIISTMVFATDNILSPISEPSVFLLCINDSNAVKLSFITTNCSIAEVLLKSTDSP